MYPTLYMWQNFLQHCRKKSHAAHDSDGNFILKSKTKCTFLVCGGIFMRDSLYMSAKNLSFSISPSTFIFLLVIVYPFTSDNHAFTLVNHRLPQQKNCHMLFSPDLQLSSTTCWISPPRKGTLTSSSCSRLRAEAKPVTKGTYFRELVGPAQFRMTKVLRLTHRKSLKGCGLVRRTHFR